MVQGGRISALNSAPVVATGPKMEKKASRNWLLRLAFRMSGRLDSNQRPPEPHSGERVAQNAEIPAISARTLFHTFHIVHEIHKNVWFSLQSLQAGCSPRPVERAVAQGIDARPQLVDSRGVKT
jgi:hypothetical protein